MLCTFAVNVEQEGVMPQVMSAKKAIVLLTGLLLAATTVHGIYWNEERAIESWSREQSTECRQFHQLPPLHSLLENVIENLRTRIWAATRLDIRRLDITSR